jgi:UDP-3-O-[3-hydroxymyristoyl] glucosamine N-acyltransferase
MSVLTTQQLAQLVAGELRGEATRPIVDVASLREAGPHHVSFVERSSSTSVVTTAAGAVIASPESLGRLDALPETSVVLVDRPLDAFVKAMLHFRPAAPPPTVGLSPLADISPQAILGRGCQVFARATIDEDAILGERCLVYPGAYIGRGCRLGDDVVIHANAVLYPEVVIGHRVIVHATAVIGADGFGYQFHEGRFCRIPHTGTVRIEDDVEIGAGTTIDRAMIGQTVIGTGTKIDNQVMIAHNCRVGRHNAIASQVGLAGSVETGDYVRFGGQVGVADHARIGHRCSLGAKAGVHGQVPEGADYHGYPAGPAREQYRIVTSLQRVPEMRVQLRELGRQVAELRAQLAEHLPAGPVTPTVRAA